MTTQISLDRDSRVSDRTERDTRIDVFRALATRGDFDPGEGRIAAIFNCVG